VFGPHMHNFRDIASRLLEAGAAIQVRDSRELARVSLELLGDGERRTRMGEMAHRLLESESGATARVLEHLQEFLETA
jgi:3-deoxy-D-manno-octulosonic-acid transferase